jgi:hypothetical protein
VFAHVGLKARAALPRTPLGGVSLGQRSRLFWRSGERGRRERKDLPAALATFQDPCRQFTTGELAVVPDAAPTL